MSLCGNIAKFQFACQIAGQHLISSDYDKRDGPGTSVCEWSWPHIVPINFLRQYSGEETPDPAKQLAPSNCYDFRSLHNKLYSC